MLLITSIFQSVRNHIVHDMMSSMSTDDLLVLRDPVYDVYALYNNGQFVTAGVLVFVVAALCDAGLGGFYSLSDVDPVLGETMFPRNLPSFLSNDRVVFALSSDEDDDTAGLYESGQLVFSGEKETVAERFLQEVGIDPVQDRPFFGASRTDPFPSIHDLEAFEAGLQARLL